MCPFVLQRQTGFQHLGRTETAELGGVGVGGGRPQPAIGHVPRAFPVDTLLACTHFLSPFVSTLGPLLAVSWVCCLDALVCFSEDRPSVVLLAKLLLSVSLVTSGDVICLF